VTPVRRVAICALVVGGVSFVGGYVGPILFSKSNLGPLLGVFLTGPIGTIVGAAFGMAWAAREWPSDGPVLAIFATTWLATWLYVSSFMNLSAGFAGWVVIPLVSLLIAMPFVIRTPFAKWIGLSGATTIAAIVFVPIARSATRFAFFLDPRLASSRHVPLLELDRVALLLEMVVALAMVMGALVIEWRSKLTAA
jgi:hypothetical protein